MIINLFVIRLCSKVSFCFVLWIDRLFIVLFILNCQVIRPHPVDVDYLLLFLGISLF